MNGSHNALWQGVLDAYVAVLGVFVCDVCVLDVEKLIRSRFLLQEQYQNEQEKLKKEWEKAQLEVEEEERKHIEEVDLHMSKSEKTTIMPCCSRK